MATVSVKQQGAIGPELPIDKNSQATTAGCNEPDDCESGLQAARRSSLPPSHLNRDDLTQRRTSTDRCEADDLNFSSNTFSQENSASPSAPPTRRTSLTPATDSNRSLLIKKSTLSLTRDSPRKEPVDGIPTVEQEDTASSAGPTPSHNARSFSFTQPEATPPPELQLGAAMSLRSDQGEGSTISSNSKMDGAGPIMEGSRSGLDSVAAMNQSDRPHAEDPYPSSLSDLKTRPGVEQHSPAEQSHDRSYSDADYMVDSSSDSDLMSDDEFELERMAEAMEPQPKITLFEPSRLEPTPIYTWMMLKSFCGGRNGALFFFASPVILWIVALILSISFTNLIMGLSIAGCFKYVFTNYVHWAHHMAPDENECRSAAAAGQTKHYWLSRRVEVRQHHVKAFKKVWSPIVSIEQVNKRAFCTVGLTLRAYLRDLFTYAIEYKIQAIARVVAVDMKYGRFHREATPEALYKIALNSACACYMSAETGHLTFYDTSLPYNQSGIKLWHRIILELDHQARVGLRVLMQEKPAEPGEPAEMVELRDMLECIAVITQIGMLKAHVHVHWFSNGVAELTDKWGLADVAADMVQGLNNGSVFSTGGVYMNSTQTMARVLADNAITEGLPLHFDLGALGEHSKMHLMSSAARKALYQAFPSWPRMQVEALVAATVMHSADHYYGDEECPWVLRSEFLRSDFTIARSTVMGPNRYFSRKLLCREHPNDLVCKTIYDACLPIDEKFANTALFLSVSN